MSSFNICFEQPPPSGKILVIQMPFCQFFDINLYAQVHVPSDLEMELIHELLSLWKYQPPDYCHWLRAICDGNNYEGFLNWPINVCVSDPLRQAQLSGNKKELVKSLFTEEQWRRLGMMN